jgi:hypothetical protein
MAVNIIAQDTESESGETFSPNNAYDKIKVITKYYKNYGIIAEVKK